MTHFRSNQNVNFTSKSKTRWELCIKCFACCGKKRRKQPMQTHNPDAETIKSPMFWWVSCPLQGTLQQWWINSFPSELWVYFFYLEHMLQAAAGEWETQRTVLETDCLPMLELMCHDTDWCKSVMTVGLTFCLLLVPGIIRLIVAGLRALKGNVYKCRPDKIVM